MSLPPLKVQLNDEVFDLEPCRIQDVSELKRRMANGALLYWTMLRPAHAVLVDPAQRTVAQLNFFKPLWGLERSKQIRHDRYDGIYQVFVPTSLAIQRRARPIPRGSAMKSQPHSVGPKHPLRALTTAQLQALQQWIKHYRNWKQELDAAWMRAGARTAYYSPELQQIRNCEGNTLLQETTAADVEALLAERSPQLRTTPNEAN